MKSRVILIVIGVSLGLGIFQNCGSGGFSSGTASETSRPQNQPLPLLGGEGYDGKIYRSYGLCGENPGALKSEIRVPNGSGTAELTIDACEKLEVGQAIAGVDVSLATDKVLIFRDMIFDLHIPNPEKQRYTTNLCRGMAQSELFEIQTWLSAENLKEVKGSIAFSNGFLSPQMALSSARENVFYFTDLDGNSASLNLMDPPVADYALDWGPLSQPIPVKCLAQAHPRVELQFTEPGKWLSWYVPPGVTSLDVKVIGGGGGGGGGDFSATGGAPSGGGGGGGSQLSTSMTVTPGQRLLFVVGKAGEGGVPGVNYGHGKGGGLSVITDFTTQIRLLEAHGGHAGLGAEIGGHGGSGAISYRCNISCDFQRGYSGRSGPNGGGGGAAVNTDYPAFSAGGTGRAGVGLPGRDGLIVVSFGANGAP